MKTIEAWRAELMPSARRIAAAVLEHLPADGVLVDVGANIGLVTELVLQERPRASAICFEPCGGYARICAATATLKGTRVVVYECGLSDVTDWATLYVHGENLGWNTLDATYADQAMKPVIVRLMKLDDFSVRRMDVLKIDVESWEGHVLAGGRQTILQHRPAIVMELSRGSSMEMWRQKVAELEFLFGHGYERIEISPDETRDVILLPTKGFPKT